MNTNDVIEHHGVKGMKWGRRAAKKISSGIDRFMDGVDKLNKAYANTHRGMLDDYSNIIVESLVPTIVSMLRKNILQNTIN